ncbi:MAG TPA: hypothetical protein VFV58_00255 [Blastocatellia bacterium]|nr:hypothetical protein [Blastocatellia bacterium]
MKLFLFLLLAPFFVMTHQESSSNPGSNQGGNQGVARGSLRVNEKSITLRHAYAHLHDNAEGLLDQTERFRVLFTDREVPPNALDGIGFLPVMDLARRGQVQGLLFEMDPDDPNNVVMTTLLPPSGQGRFLIRQTINVTGGDLFKDWTLTDRRIVGATEHRGEREPGLSDFPAISYSVQFDAPVFNEPQISADLKGRAALDSPEARLLSAKADALAKGDFEAAQKASTERANHWNQAFLAGAKADSLTKKAAELKKALQKIQRVVERGDRAVAILSGKQWFTFVREGGEWKSDD